MERRRDNYMLYISCFGCGEEERANSEVGSMFFDVFKGIGKVKRGY